MGKTIIENAEECVRMPGTGMGISASVHFQNTFRRLSARICLVVMDFAGLVAALTIAFEIRVHVLPAIVDIFPKESPPPLSMKIWWILGIVFLCFAYERLYTRRLPFWRETKRLISVINLAFIIILAGVSLAKLGGEVSRTVLVLAYLISLILLPLDRYLLKSSLAAMGIWQENILILGTGITGRKIAAALIRDRYLGYRIYGFLGKGTVPGERIEINKQSFPIYGDFTEAERILQSAGIRQVIIAAPELSGKSLVSLTQQLQPYTRSILLVPDLSGVPVVGGETEYFYNDRILAYRTKNNLAYPANITIKRLFDVVIGFIIFLLILPVLAIIAVAIKLDSPGKVGFSHRRVGQCGKYFDCYKFRTMVANSQEVLEDLLANDPALREEWKDEFKLKDDPRITRVGKFLRETSLDELPQIFNVIKGDMSLVGPRPIIEAEIEKFDVFIKEYFMVLPGMTGLWAVSGRNDIEYDERVQMETWYVRNWSLWMDISLLFQTIPVVLGRKGAY